MRAVIRLASSLIVFLTIAFLWPRELDGFTPGRDGRLAVPDYAMTNVHYVSVQEGKVELESFSRDAAYDLAKRQIDATVVTSYFYNQLQEKTEVKADRASFFLADRRVHLLDNVESTSPDGFVMKGPEAIYLLGPRTLTAPQPVAGEMKDNSMKVWGDRAESSLDERKVELIGNAISHFEEKKKGLTKIRGDRALLDREKQVVTFRDNVRVDQEKTVATSRRAELYYSPQEKSLRYMSLLENVRIEESGGRYTRSEVAEFFAPTDTIVLSNFPSVYNGDDVVTGDRITLYRGTGVVEVTATNAAGSPDRPFSGPAAPLTTEDEELIP
jgi:LPS export ABC transporter protein LptC